jgi:PAS domain S-box-containing protein
VVCSFTDVTDQLGTERLFHQAFDGAPAGLAMLDLDGVIRTANPATARLAGRPVAALRGLPVDELVHPEDRDRAAAALDRLVAGDEIDHQLDLRFGTPGGWLWTSVRRSLVRDERGHPAYVVLVVTDVTERHALVTALRDRLATLEDLNVALADFAGRAAHDLKSPLVAMNAFATTLRARWADLDDATREELLERIAGASARASAMVSGMLAEAHRTGVSHATAADPSAALEAALGNTGVPRSAVAVSGEWPPVAVAATDLVSVFTNILDNARHYGRSADGTLTVRITAAVRDDVLVVDCADAGPGLPDPERMFEPFVRGDGSASANPDSTGLGLALVRRAVQRWGGSATGCTAPGGGALVRLALPLV